jgi:hypothetical protein
MHASFANRHGADVWTGVERILEHFLDHGGGAVDNLASGDLVGNLVGEYADAAHLLFSRYRAGIGRHLLACDHRIPGLKCETWGTRFCSGIEIWATRRKDDGLI